MQTPLKAATIININQRIFLYNLSKEFNLYVYDYQYISSFDEFCQKLKLLQISVFTMVSKLKVIPIIQSSNFLM